MFRKKKSVIILSSLFLAVLIFSGAGCAKEKSINPGSVNLQWWGVWNDADQVAPLIAVYRTNHPYINITYRKFRSEEFETKLIEALAEDRGPDIVSLHNSWILRYQSKLLPLPDKPLTVAVGKQVKSGAGAKTVYSNITVPVLNSKIIKDKFVPAVFGDAVADGKIYGLPMSVDSLVLFYNRSLLARAKITRAPATWQEVLDAARLITTQDKEGKLTDSAIALGTSNNVPRYFDILSLLMMQSGAEMTDLTGKSATFNLALKLGGNSAPAVEALEFYTNFANPNKESYTWNASMPDAVEAFAGGQLAMMLGYAYNLPQIRAKTPGLDIGVAPIPQLNPSYETNYANYWLEAALKKTKHPNEAWDFIQFIASQENTAKIYVEKTGRPPALRSLVDAYKEDSEKGVFALSALSAKNWYHGKNPAAAENVFADMINSVLDGAIPIQEALNSAAQRINQTF